MTLDEYLRKLELFRELRTLSTSDIQAAIIELSVRLRVIEQERADDSVETQATLCSCGGGGQKHLDICPQSDKRLK